MHIVKKEPKKISDLLENSKLLLFIEKRQISYFQSLIKLSVSKTLFLKPDVK